MQVQDNVESPVASIDRALRILALIGGAATGLSLDELAAKLDIPKSSLHRILAALKFRKFVSQPEIGGAYFLGTELLATAFRFHDTLDLRALIHPLLVRLSGELHETTHMAVLDGAEIVYQDKIEVATHTIKLSSVIGGRNPAHATGVGKALLAWTYSHRRGHPSMGGAVGTAASANQAHRQICWPARRRTCAGARARLRPGHGGE